MNKQNKILVVLGSTRDGRFGLRVARLLMDQLKVVGLDPKLIDPLEIDPPVLRQPLHFMSPDDQAKAPEWMKNLSGEINDARGLVLVSCEYNATIPPALTNLLDHFAPRSYRHKPVSVVTYSMGSFGGSRARVALLPFVNELGMVCLPSSLTIPNVAKADIDEAGKTENARILQNAAKLSKEMLFYATALEKERKEAGGYPN